MNSKLVKASLAGAAAIALAAGGSTFAAWSDLGFLNNQQVKAGHLVLNLGTPTTASTDPMNLAPGQNDYRVFEVASNDGLSVPKAELSITLQNVRNTEDGCTSNSEAIAEGADPFASGYDPATACGGPTAGELSQEAIVEIYQYGPSDNGQCSKVNPETIPGNVVVNRQYFSGVVGIKEPVVALNPGEKTCVSVLVNLDATGARAADNKVQGDSMVWDTRFDLDQIV